MAARNKFLAVGLASPLAVVLAMASGCATDASHPTVPAATAASADALPTRAASADYIYADSVYYARTAAQVIVQSQVVVIAQHTGSTQVVDDGRGLAATAEHFVVQEVLTGGLTAGEKFDVQRVDGRVSNPQGTFVLVDPDDPPYEVGTIYLLALHAKSGSTKTYFAVGPRAGRYEVDRGRLSSPTAVHDENNKLVAPPFEGMTVASVKAQRVQQSAAG